MDADKQAEEDKLALEEKYNDNLEGLIERFELRSAFPPRLLTDSMTLEEAGLVPNGTIHARRLN
jgi:hypothetical protein